MTGISLYNALSDKVLDEPGAYFVVDGQFGSTGKGLISAALGRLFADRPTVVTNNAGPNSGHTHYNKKGEQVVLKQLPSFMAAAAEENKSHFRTYLNAGSVINLNQLRRDIDSLGLSMYAGDIVVDPYATVITPDAIHSDEATVSSIASTGQGVGPAIADKVMRKPDAVMKATEFDDRWKVNRVDYKWVRKADRIMVEVSQGYSLGINSGFYPHCTSRECSVQQAMSDARIPVSKFRKCILSVRTFPIRVGNTTGSSGPCYPDQREISWDDIGVEPEYTTVTGRMRRVFTWSEQQFTEAVRHNDAGIIFLNFLNYLPKEDQWPFVARMMDAYRRTMGDHPECVIGGFGPRFEDLEVLY